MDLSTALALLASAFLGTAVVIANVGLRYLDPARGALVSIPSTTLLFWLLALFLFRGEGWNATAGTAAIVLGVIALTARGADRPRAWAAWVVLLPLAGAAIRGGAQAAVKGGLVLWPDPFVAALIGYTVSSATIFAANRVFVPRASATLDRHGIFWFMAVGLCNGVGVLAMYAALNRGQVSVVSPLVATYPLFTLALSALFLREERFGPRVLLGVALTVAGVVVLARA